MLKQCWKICATALLLQFLIAGILFVVQLGSFDVNFNQHQFSGRLELRCCKCDNDKENDDPFNHLKSKLDQAVCDRFVDARTQPIIIDVNNMTCPSSFDDTDMGNVVGCEDPDEFSASSTATSAMAMKMKQGCDNPARITNSLLLSPKGKWVKCCCSPYFCKFMVVLKTKNNGDQGQRPPLPRQKWISVRAFLQAVNNFLIQFVLSVLGSFLIIEVILAFMADPTNLWNDRAEPMDAQEVVFRTVRTLVEMFRISAGSP